MSDPRKHISFDPQPVDVLDRLDSIAPATQDMASTELCAVLDAARAEITRLRAALATARDEGAGAMKAHFIDFLTKAENAALHAKDLDHAESIQAIAEWLKTYPATGAHERAVAEARRQAFEEAARVAETWGVTICGPDLTAEHATEVARTIPINIAHEIRDLAEKEVGRG